MKFLVILIAVIFLCSVEFVQSDGGRVVEQLDHQHGKFLAAWEVKFNTHIIFELTVETTGYVGFGFSVHGGMNDADIMIGGVLPNGTPYIGDYHGVGNTMPKRDKQEDWVLLSGTENGTHTSLRIQRSLVTGDTKDIAITSGKMNLIWAYGLTDDLIYHAARRGTHVATLLTT